MRTILRYSVPILNGTTSHSLVGKIVHVSCKNDDIVDFWAEVDSDMSCEVIRKFEVYPTGSEIPSDAQYIGTAVSPSRNFVWHLVERLV